MATETLRRPRQTVKLAPESGEGCAWCQAAVGGKPAMHIVCRCRATNIIGNPVYLLKAYIDKPYVEGDIVVKHYKTDIYSTYPIFPHSTGRIAAHFFIQPMRCGIGEDFKLTVTVIDMYGNEHHTGKISFKGLTPESKMAGLTGGESVSDILDPVEKKVVEILKMERCRYENCGKKEGGLGSVITTYNDRIKIGVGSDLRTLCAPEDQPIVNYPENARIESDNADLLLDYYRSLKVHQDKEIFREALLKRIDKDGEYKAVGYFPVLVLIKIDRLAKALETAKNNLHGDSEYGFCNVLMLLDGMLKYKYNDFTNDELDEVEIFLDDIEEHTFRISERLAAIRNLRHIR